MPSDPPLSVVMPVRDALPYLHESIASILGQTFTEFELVIRDNASSDGSREALRAWAARDERIRLFEGDAPLGFVGSANWVVRHSRGELVARMDADDVAHPDRLRRQVEVLRAHPDVDLVGALWEGMDERGRVVRRRDRWRLVRSSPFAPFPHTAIAFRRAAFDRVGAYRDEVECWEDGDLYLRMAEHGRVAVLPEPLVRVRHSRSGNRLREPERVERAYDRMFRALDESLPAAAAERLLPQAFISLAAVELWAGGRPRVLGRLLSRGRLRPDRQSAAAIAWALWAAGSPGTLRTALRMLHRLRDIGVGDRVQDGLVYEWVPDRPSRVLE